jgi:hypothetical protein
MSPPLSNGYDVRLLYLYYLEVAGSNPAGGLVTYFFFSFQQLSSLAYPPICGYTTALQ